MSTPQQRAADIAAREVESLVVAAQAAADKIKDGVRREMTELRRNAVQEADEMRAEAKKEASAELEAARKTAIQLGEDARKEADVRVADAQRAADEALDEARAVSRGLRQLADALTDQAGRILREVETGHRRVTSELRAPTRGGPRPERSEGEERPPAPRRTAGKPSLENPFDELEVPGWLGG
ncbi:MAG: hypothetical protein WD844_13480 [Thermoleophilaceae bacterium]